MVPRLLTPGPTKILKVADTFCTISSNLVCLCTKGKEVLIAKNVLVWVLLHSSYEPNTQRAMKILYLFENCFLYGFESFPFS
jgi:hypothetical protein